MTIHSVEFDSKHVRPDDIRLAEAEFISIRQGFNQALLLFLKKQHEVVRKSCNEFEKKARLELISRIEGEIDSCLKSINISLNKVKEGGLKRIK